VTLELVFTGLFTLEIVLRFIAANRIGNGRSFWKGYIVWIDVVSVIPFYILTVWCATNGSSPWGNECGDIRSRGVLRVLQAVKMLRVFKLVRHFSGTRLLVRAIQRSYAALLPSLLFLFASALVFAALLFSTDNWLAETSAFEDLPSAAYYCLVTMSSVGYGDIVPEVRPTFLVVCWCSVGPG